MRVITFSRYFPSTHPRKGERTFFVEKMVRGYLLANNPLTLSTATLDFGYLDQVPNLSPIADFKPKYHTIRPGSRWTVGDLFDPRIWSDNPYKSKQIAFMPPIKIKKIWTFEVDLNGIYSINGKYWMEDHEVAMLAQNDGLSVEDMMYWFMPNINKPKKFQGQILSWNENIEYA